MNRVRELKRREKCANPPRAASTPRTGPPFGVPNSSSTPLFSKRAPLRELNGVEPALEISTIPMEGANRGRIQSDNTPSIETFSQDSIGESATVFQMTTGNVRQFLSRLNAKKNKYKQMALQARNDLKQRFELFVKIEEFQALKTRLNFMFVALIVCVILIVSCLIRLHNATATTNGSPYV